MLENNINHILKPHITAQVIELRWLCDTTYIINTLFYYDQKQLENIKLVSDEIMKIVFI